MREQVGLKELERHAGVDRDTAWSALVDRPVRGEQQRRPKALAAAHRQVPRRVDHRRGVVAELARPGELDAEQPLEPEVHPPAHLPEQ